MDNIPIKYCDSGIIKVIVNTDIRWCGYSIWRNDEVLKHSCDILYKGKPIL